MFEKLLHNSNGQLRRLLGDNPDGASALANLLGPVSGSLALAGRALYAGLVKAYVPDDPLGAAWRYADRLRRPRWRNGQPQTNIPPGPLSGG